MPRKPSHPYGYIAFSKSGKVRKHISRLSDVKQEQEEEVARQFCKYLPRDDEELARFESLPDRGHDFLLHFRGQDIEVQITEIVQREYATPLTTEEYHSDRTRFAHYYVGEGAQMLGIDVTKRDGMFVQRIEQKRNKHYQRPKNNGLWLCIFASDAHLSPVSYQAGELVKSAPLLNAETYCASEGIAPFDQVWVMVLGLRPHRVWPRENAG